MSFLHEHLSLPLRLSAPSFHVSFSSAEGNSITMRISFDVTQEEVTIVELVDATDPGEHNGDIATDADAAGLASRTISLDDSTSQANVSIYVTVISV